MTNKLYLKKSSVRTMLIDFNKAADKCDLDGMQLLYDTVKGFIRNLGVYIDVEDGDHLYMVASEMYSDIHKFKDCDSCNVNVNQLLYDLAAARQRADRLEKVIVGMNKNLHNLINESTLDIAHNDDLAGFDD